MIEIPNFTVERELGRGGMATVYLAVQDMLSRNVALKVMLPDMARDENFRKSFLSEGKIIANLEHPNIVRIHDFGIIDDSILYMAMEYLSDGTLKEKVSQGKLSYETALKIIEDAAAGLAYAHAKGYIHRDIKPGNILFRDDGTAVLTDFGIAKLQDTSGELTRMGYTMGTVQYMSPEQAITTDLDHRSDIYSLGLVFYEMLTGQKAFKAESTIQAIHQHTTVAPPELPPEYSFLQETINKVLAKEPEDRFQSINDFVEAVRNARDIDKTVIHRIPPVIDDDSTQIIRTGHYQVQQTPDKKSHKGKYLGIASALLLIGGLAFGVTKYPAIESWLNTETPKEQNENQVQQALDNEKKQRELIRQEELANKEKELRLAEKAKQREFLAAEIKKQEAEKIERDRILAEKTALAKKQAVENERTAENERKRLLAEAELKKLEEEKIEKDKLLAIKIANAKKQAEEDRKTAEAQLQKIEAEKKERERILAEQIAKAKKQAEEAEKARALAEKERVAAEKLREEKQKEAEKKERERILAEQIAKAKKQSEEAEEARALAEKERIAEEKLKEEKLKQAQLEEKRKKEEQEALAKLEQEKKQQEELAKKQEQEKIELALAEKKRLETEQQNQEAIQKAEQERLDAEVAALRKQREAKREQERIAEQNRKDKLNAEKKAKEELARRKARDAKKKQELAQKKARDAKRKKEIARNKVIQEKKRQAAIIAKRKADAARKKQQAARSKGQIRVSATLNGRPLNTTFIVTKNGKKVQAVSGRSSANFVLPAGRYVVTTQYSGKSSRANVNLEPYDIVTQGFAFRGSVAVQQPKPVPNKWTHEHKN